MPHTPPARTLSRNLALHCLWVLLLPGITLFPGYPPLTHTFVLDPDLFDKVLDAAREGRRADAIQLIPDKLFKSETDGVMITIKKRLDLKPHFR